MLPSRIQPLYSVILRNYRFIIVFVVFYIFVFVYVFTLFYSVFVIVMNNQVVSTSLKCQFSIPSIYGAKIRYFKEADYECTILKGTLPFLKQEMSLFKIFKEWVPNPNLFKSPRSGSPTQISLDQRVGPQPKSL